MRRASFRSVKSLPLRCSADRSGSSGTLPFVANARRGINKVILLGNVGKDAQIKHIEGGGFVAFFPLATNQVFTSKDGERVNRPQWHNVVIYNDNFVQTAQQSCKKGTLVYVEGMLQYRKYQGVDGKEKTITEVVLPKFRGDLNVLSHKPRDDGKEEELDDTPLSDSK